MLDEIATGFGRTGTLFAAEAAGVTPDVMCVGKALTGGYLTQSAMLCTSEVATVVSGGEAGCASCTVRRSWPTPWPAPSPSPPPGLLASGEWRTAVQRIETGLRAALAPARSVGVSDVRVMGAIGVIELDHPVDVAAATAAAVAAGGVDRLFRDSIYTMPPYITADDDVAAIGDALVTAARAG